MENDITISMEKEFLKKGSPLFQLEDNFLNISSSDSSDSLFCCTVFSLPTEEHGNVVMARYFESGSFSGFFRNIAHGKIKETLQLDCIIPYNVYTSTDIEMNSIRKKKLFANTKKGKETSTSSKGRAYVRNLHSNKSSVKQIVDKVKPSIENDSGAKCLLLCCYVMHKVQTWGSSDMDRRFMICDGDGKFWEEMLLSFRTTQKNDAAVLKYDQAVTSIDLSLEQQFDLLSSIPNFHKWSWNPLNKKDELKFDQRLSTCCRYFPGSPRNRILQACSYRDDPSSIVSAIFLILLGKSVGIPYPKKKIGCKNAKRNSRNTLHLLTTSSNDVDVQTDNCSDVENDVQPEKLENVASSFRETLFQYYCGQIFNNGILKWRYKDSIKQIAVMNDYDAETGDFKNFDYVHVTASASTVGPLYYCTCQIFSLSQNSVEVAGSTSNVRWEGVACLHTRLFACIMSSNPMTGFIEPESSDIKNINANVINDGLQYTQNLVIELPAKMSVKKYSVLSGESASVVSLFKVRGSSRKVVQCLNSLCGIEMGTKRSIDTIRTSSDLCPHLMIYRDYLLSEHSEEDEEDASCPDDSDGFADEENLGEESTSNSLPDIKWKDIFNEDTGLWTFGSKSPSQLKVDIDPFSERLEQSVCMRDNLTNVDPAHNYLPDTEGTCPCEAGWISEEFPEGITVLRGTTNLYLEKMVVKCNVYSRKCARMTCIREWDGASDSIFRFSGVTCAGYEIGWEFVDAVSTSGQTFSGYVSMCNNRYKRRNRNATPFMSVPVFVDWFFAWISHMHIDFRQPCYWCGGTSQILACDGTKIGVGFKNAFVKPIEQPEKPDIVETKLKRLDRCFLFNTRENEPRCFQQARKDLERCCKHLMSTNPEDNLEPQEFRNLAENVVNMISPYSQCSFSRMVGLSGECSSGEKKALAKFFILLSSDSSIDTILPFRFCADVSEITNGCLNGSLSTTDLQVFVHRSKFFCPELSAVFLTSSLSTSTQYPHIDVLHLIDYLVAAIRNVHTFDEPADDPAPIVGTYNPPKYGRAYYFNDHGCQIRQMRSFSIDKDKKNNFDDSPDMRCEKKFPTVSKRGTTYLFLWFCPTHGHCYGFHVIPGSEGRKDPAASLYTHLENSPDDILYDFACSLSEYSKNRESGYFAKTRFFHDVFHGYTHKCTKAFRCNRLLGFSAVNSSICEQFNSYIQKIKASARLMSQAHFMLYLQFFIHRWNQAKFETFRKKLRVAVSGRDDSFVT